MLIVNAPALCVAHRRKHVLIQCTAGNLTTLTLLYFKPYHGKHVLHCGLQASCIVDCRQLDLYVAAAGFPPASVLPVVIDVGTDNLALRDDKCAAASNALPASLIVFYWLARRESATSFS